MKKQIVFISGLGGTGKSSLVWYFMENPVRGFSFYDFDKGKYKIPPYGENHLEWRTNMTKWWLEVGDKEYEVKGNVIVVIGLSLYPQSIFKLYEANSFDENICFGHLLCDPDVRKLRLEARGDAHHWGGHKDWYDEFFASMKDVGAREFDTTNDSVEQTAAKVIKWLKKL